MKKFLGHLSGGGPVALACVGLGSITAGVYELVGSGWALVAGGAGAVLIAIDWRAAG